MFKIASHRGCVARRVYTRAGGALTSARAHERERESSPRKGNKFASQIPGAREEEKASSAPSTTFIRGSERERETDRTCKFRDLFSLELSKIILSRVAWYVYCRLIVFFMNRSFFVLASYFITRRWGTDFFLSDKEPPLISPREGARINVFIILIKRHYLRSAM